MLLITIKQLKNLHLVFSRVSLEFAFRSSRCVVSTENLWSESFMNTSARTKMAVMQNRSEAIQPSGVMLGTMKSRNKMVSCNCRSVFFSISSNDSFLTFYQRCREGDVIMTFRYIFHIKITSVYTLVYNLFTLSFLCSFNPLLF